MTVNKSMLAFLKKKNPYEQAARDVYAGLLAASRRKEFFSNYGVPDNFDGRFDLLLLHIFIVVTRMTGEGKAGQDFNQALFDATFADMDQTLREMGIGDMGIPKHMRRMMKAFNGRIHAYTEAAEQGEGALAVAVRRNLYGTLEDSEIPDVKIMVRYMTQSMDKIARFSFADIAGGSVSFDLPE